MMMTFPNSEYNVKTLDFENKKYNSVQIVCSISRFSYQVSQQYTQEFESCHFLQGVIQVYHEFCR